MKVNRLNEYKRLLMDKRYIEAYKHIPPELIKTTTLLGNYFSDSYNGRKSLIFKFIFGSLDMENTFKGIDVSLFGPGYSKKDIASDKGKVKVWLNGTFPLRPTSKDVLALSLDRFNEDRGKYIDIILGGARILIRESAWLSLPYWLRIKKKNNIHVLHNHPIYNGYLNLGTLVLLNILYYQGHMGALNIHGMNFWLTHTYDPCYTLRQDDADRITNFVFKKHDPIANFMVLYAAASSKEVYLSGTIISDILTLKDPIEGYLRLLEDKYSC